MAKYNSQPPTEVDVSNVDLSDEFYSDLDAYAKAIRRQVRPKRKGLARLLLGP